MSAESPDTPEPPSELEIMLARALGKAVPLPSEPHAAEEPDVIEPENDSPRRCGLIAIVGKPNVGKSTLLNALVGQKLSITSRKAQTTRHRITGILTQGGVQYVFVDTPGFQTRHGKALNRSLNRTVTAAVGDVDLILFVVEATRFGLDDAQVLALLPKDKPNRVAIN